VIEYLLLLFLENCSVAIYSKQLSYTVTFAMGFIRHSKETNFIISPESMLRLEALKNSELN